MSDLIKMPDSIVTALNEKRASDELREAARKLASEEAAEQTRNHLAELATAAGIEYTAPEGPAPESTFLGNSNAPSMHQPIGGPR